jgi:hypothetical protein
MLLEAHSHPAVLLRKHLLLSLVSHESLLLCGPLLHHCGVHHACMLLLLLLEHLGLLGLQMRKCMRVGPHSWLHAHHGPCLADGTVRTGYAWMHARWHRLAGVRSRSSHRVPVR